MNNFNSDIKINHYYGHAHMLSDDDKRLSKFREQHDSKGFDETEWWSLDHTIILFTLPRLKDFAKNTKSCPCSLTFNEWVNILNQMIEGMELYLDWNIEHNDLESQNKINNGMKLFFEYFSSLWS